MARPRIENDLTFARQGTIVEEMVGWQDYDDATTATTPITLPLADTWYKLTNDGAGSRSSEEFRVNGKPLIWNTDTSQFYFGDLFIGGMQFLRTSFFVETPSANTEIEVRLRMAIGSGIDYSIPVYQRYLKAGNKKYQFSPVTFFTIDNPQTRDFPAEIQIRADVAGCEVEVDGWKIMTIDRY